MSSFGDEPPQRISQQPMPPSPFSSLPLALVLKILARVSKRSYPILACVSKNFRHLVRSPEIQKTRSLLGKDSLFICFAERTNHWFTLRRTKNNPRENQFLSVDLTYPYLFDRNPSVIAVGPEIFFISGPQRPYSSVWIFDSRSYRIRQGPSLKPYQEYKSVGFVGRKLYVIGGYRNFRTLAESFDIEVQTWDPAPIPEAQGEYMWTSTTTASFDKKVYALDMHKDSTIGYDTRDGSWDGFALPKDYWWKTGVCVIDNVLYIYCDRLDLMWYDSKLSLWKVVNGLNHLSNVRSVGMAEYYGKLAFLWEESSDDDSSETKKIWCRMIALDRSEEGIHGTAEPAQLLTSVPTGYRLDHCLSVSD